MGLLWALKPEKILIRLLKRDVMNNTLQVQLKLYDSDIMVTHVAITTPNVSMILERWYVIPGVTRILIKEGCLQGACFLPPGEYNYHGYCHPFSPSFESLLQEVCL